MNTGLKNDISIIESAILAIAENTALYEEANFNERADALEFIELHIDDRIEGLLQSEEPNNKLDVLKQYAEKVKCDLERINVNLFMQLREKVASGIYFKSSFKKMISNYLQYDTNNLNAPGESGYDNLDVFINGILSEKSIPEPTIEAKPGMVFYQKTPARIIFKLVKQAKLKHDDIFFDLGSGLGQAVILVNLISGINTRGVEYEPAFYNYSKTCASQLNLSGVEFINIDALGADYSQGNIFFLYSPFEGGMLQDMLDMLHKQSIKKKLRLFTYGPCSLHTGSHRWLKCINGNADNLYELYEFRSLSAGMK